MPPAIGKWGLGIHTNSSKDIRMKLKLILSTMIAAVAMMANAQDTKRADVKAEAKAANVAGEIAKGDVEAKAPKAAKSTKARADVKAKAKAANKAGEISEGEVDKTKPAKSTKARADVKAEAKAANKAGEIKKGEVSK